ncbi:recombinase family protein [Chakrabartyella piscis]|uniref:recombinase family protein n=1 Tax=Chakrabartyella piscis TaxID=2918914 RepID=UPI0029585FBD|nr:recombinase family protein [Chakrabartyella piscis]
MIYQVGAYLRLSRDDERNGESLSIENQREIIKEYVAKKGWIYKNEYIDDGLTGTNFERPSFQRMVDDARNGEINCIITKDLSRFGRNYIEIGQYTDYLFPSIGCRFIAINDGVDTLEKENELMPFKNLVNEWYSRDQSKKVKSAKAARAKNGYFMGAYAPYGYIKNENRMPPLLIDEEVAPIVLEMFQMRAEGLGYRAIATKLNEKKITPPREYYYQKIGKSNPKNGMKSWSDVVVRQILSNECYIGNIVQMRIGTISYKNRKIINRPQDEWVRAENMHEPIISRELWDTACRLAERGKAIARSNKNGEISLFSGLLECADCGRSMKIIKDSNVKKDGSKNNRHAYICGGYSQGGKAFCSPHRTLLSILHDLVLSQIKEYAQKIEMDEDEVIRQIKKKKEVGTSSEQKALKKNQSALSYRLTEIERLVANLYEEMVLGDIPRDTVLSMIDKYKKEQLEKTALLNEITEKLSVSREVDNDIKTWVKLIKGCTNIETIDRELMIKLIDKIIVGQKVEVDGVLRQDITIIYNLVGEEILLS